MPWLEILVSVVAGIALLYVVLLLSLWQYARRHPGTVRMRDVLRLLPDVLRLIRRLIADKGVPARARIRLAVVLIYLASPIDIVPDFIPVIGYADDVLILAWALRALMRDAGGEPLRRNWPGTPPGLRVVERLTGLPDSAAPGDRPAEG